MKLEPKNREEWQLQKEFVEKHLAMGGVPVCDEKTGVLIRFEYDNPIYKYYKDTFTELYKILSALTGDDEMRIASDGETPDTPTNITKIKTRIY